MKIFCKPFSCFFKCSPFFCLISLTTLQTARHFGVSLRMKQSDCCDRILVTEKLLDEGVVILKKNFTVDLKYELSPEELLNEIPKYDALIVGSATTVGALYCLRNLIEIPIY